jgi:lysophospholipase L1-like esterase
MNDAVVSYGRDGAKLGGEHDPEGHALGSWFPLLADRLAALWGAPQKFLNYAVGGSHTSVWQPGAQALRRAVNAFENAGARYVMFNIGATDVMEGATVAMLKERIRPTVQELQRRGFTVLLALMPFSLREDWNKGMEVQHRAVRELWDEIPGLYPGADLGLLDPALHVNRIDNVHLNAAGYREAAGLWADAYRAITPRST